jgi:rRNA-processing protein FCF1
MKILLDTNFILSCIKQKLDFFSHANCLITEKIDWLLPKEVLHELKTLSTRKGEKITDKASAQIAIEMLKLISCEEISLDSPKDVDTGIVNYANSHPGLVVATLDKGLKSRLPENKILTIKGVKGLELI